MNTKRLPDGTYIELVRSLYSTLVTTLVMAVSFVATGIVVVSRTSDRITEALTVIGALAAIGRVLVLLRNRRAARAEDLALASARVLERRFAASYLVFAVIFGTFTARSFFIAAPDVRVIIIGLLFGYAAGAAVNLAYRPWISICAITLAVAPTIFVAIALHELVHTWLAMLLSVFLCGAIESVIARYRLASSEITMSREYAALARIDPLSGLPNRLALADRFASLAKKKSTLAVHCLDLDGFKPVNDRYGHPVGDLLLRAVSDRLSALLRHEDFAARTGGDEFVVVQAVVADPSEADMLARRILRSLAAPYVIADQEIRISTSIGYGLSHNGTHDLAALVEGADRALLIAKARGGGVHTGCGEPDGHPDCMASAKVARS